jgi:hypothetical protein
MSACPKQVDLTEKGVAAYNPRSRFFSAMGR